MEFLAFVLLSGSNSATVDQPCEAADREFSVVDSGQVLRSDQPGGRSFVSPLMKYPATMLARIKAILAEY